MTSSYAYHKEDVLVDIRNINVILGGKPIIKNLTASISNLVRSGMNQGQIVGLLGPSGIGKTTLFRVLAGILEPESGTVLIGREAKPVKPGDVGVVAQNYPLLNHRTIIDNLMFAGKQSAMSDVEARKIAKEYLSEFELSEHAHKYPMQLSGGQRQRVAIAQQLICSKHYLIMDEPFSGLDPVALVKVRQMLLNVATQHEDNTFIIVTHDVTSAVSICDTIWLMGRDRDVQNQIVPGARIMNTIDLIEADICWHDDPLAQPAATTLIRDIKNRFLTL